MNYKITTGKTKHTTTVLNTTEPNSTKNDSASIVGADEEITKNTKLNFVPLFSNL